MKSPKELAQKVLTGFESGDYAIDAMLCILASAVLKLEEEKLQLVEGLTFYADRKHLVVDNHDSEINYTIAGSLGIPYIVSAEYGYVAKQALAKLKEKKIMTMPRERLNSLMKTREFLYSLLDPKATPKVPRAVRKAALRCFRHFPYEHQIASYGGLAEMVKEGLKDPWKDK